MPKRALLVGCGNMAAGWLKALAEPALSPRVDIVALVDVNPAAAEKLKSEFGLSGAAVSTNLESLLTELRPDIVFDVAVPSARKDIVLAGFSHGCDVLTEKPMATSLADARELNEAARRAGRVYAVTQNRRFKEGVRRVRATLDSGILGRINAIHSDFFIGAHFGGFRDAMQHVLLLDMAIHTFDKARFLSGKDPLAVYCQEGNPASSWYAHGSAANAIFEFSDDVIFTYRGSWSAEGANTNWDASWRIIGAKGTLLWDGEFGFTARIVDGDEGFFRPLEDIEVLPPSDLGQINGHASVIVEFLDAIESGGSPRPLAATTSRALRWCLPPSKAPKPGSAFSLTRRKSDDRSSQIDSHRHDDQCNRRRRAPSGSPRCATWVSKASSRSSGNAPTARTWPNWASAAWRRSATATSRFRPSACSAIRSKRRDGPADIAGLEGLHRQRASFRRDLRGRLHWPRARQAAAGQPSPLQAGVDANSPTRGRQGRQDRLRELRHGRQLGGRRLEHRP